MATTALVTGGSKRLGAAICRALHKAGYNLLIHYHHSAEAAAALADELNQQRPDSANCVQADLQQPDAVRDLAKTAQEVESLEFLVNNASAFYPTPIGDATDADWERILGVGLRAPFILSQALAPTLARQQGSIVNLVDIYADKPLKNYPIYSIAKAGITMLTKSLARELAPAVRVNGVAPGFILPPEAAPERANELAASVPLQRAGRPADVARSVCWLATEAVYVTGHIVPVDGGRSLSYPAG